MYVPLANASHVSKQQQGLFLIHVLVGPDQLWLCSLCPLHPGIQVEGAAPTETCSIPLPGLGFLLSNWNPVEIRASDLSPLEISIHILGIIPDFSRKGGRQLPHAVFVCTTWAIVSWAFFVLSGSRQCLKQTFSLWGSFAGFSGESFYKYLSPAIPSM